MEDYIPTIGIDFGVKGFRTVHEEGIFILSAVRINFWDIGGDEAFFDIRNEFYKDTDGVIPYS